jgi:hypothetical protein
LTGDPRGLRERTVMQVDYAKDAKFFEVVKDLTRRAEPGRSSERRGRQRQPYPCYQYVAPFRDSRMPSPEEFQQVRCHDISTGGFSYFTAELPDHDRIVAAFGTAPAFTYLTAEIHYAKRVAQGTNAMFQIGCQFLGRISGDEPGSPE